MAERLNPMDWVRAGLSLLSESGADSVRVEPLAKRLGLTKGSFYWHFADREALLSAMIAEWERAQTFAIIDQVEAGDPDAASRLERLSTTVGRLDMQLEMAMRAWASLTPKAREALQRIDATRLRYLQSLIEGAGVPTAHAEARARLLYYALVGEIMSDAMEWRRRHREAVRLIQTMILTPP